MRYPASKKAEIIQFVEASHLPARRMLETLGISMGPTAASESRHAWTISGLKLINGGPR